MNRAAEQFNDLYVRGRSWFMAREPRERLVLSIGAALVACALVYAILFAPLSSAVASRNKRIDQKRDDLSWMQTVAPQVSAYANQPTLRNSSGESMVVLVANSASGGNVSRALTGQTPDGANGVQVRFEGVQFDALVIWLSALQKEYGIRTTSAEINRTPQAGQVNAILSLQRN